MSVNNVYVISKGCNFLSQQAIIYQKVSCNQDSGYPGFSRLIVINHINNTKHLKKKLNNQTKICKLGKILLFFIENFSAQKKKKTHISLILLFLM